MSNNLNNKLLEEKKKKFLQFIKLALLTYKIKEASDVVFREGYLPDGNAVKAHIHLETKTICVSLLHLNQMTDEEIKETAFHEVNHIFIIGHDTSFFNQLNDALIASWPFGQQVGTININGNKPVKQPESIGIHYPIEKDYCNYHLCRKKIDVIRCNFCGRYFCIKHIKPVPPGLPSFNELNEFSIWKRCKECHPCPEYSDYLHNLNKRFL